MNNPNYYSGNSQRINIVKMDPSIRVEHDILIEMRDGVKLSANVYRPSGQGQYPVIMAISPYDKNIFDSFDSMFSSAPDNDLGEFSISDHVSFEAPDPNTWVPYGYAVVQVDIRGQGKSEGDTNMYGTSMQEDFIELIAWAAAQPWSTGKIGLMGVSYLAVSQWYVAQHRPPALAAIVPWEGRTDIYRGQFWNGIREVGFREHIAKDWVGPRHNPECAFVPWPGGPDEIAQHPLFDSWWESHLAQLERINVPALICASFSCQELHSRESFDAFNRVGSPQKWMVSHRRPEWQGYYCDEGIAIQRRFFDRFLKGVNNGMDAVAPIQLEINRDREAYKRRELTAWPPPHAILHELDLDAVTGTLVESGTGKEGAVEYPATDGSLSFAHVFDREIDIVGNMRLRLWIQVDDVDDADLFIGIRKIDTDGNEVYFSGLAGHANDIVARGWVRVSQRALDETLSSHGRPVQSNRVREPLSPGQIVAVDVEILPSATTFLPGETMIVIVQSQQVQPDAPLLRFITLDRGTLRIHTGGDYRSFLVFPELPRE